jgi:hypothetical protein
MVLAVFAVGRGWVGIPESFPGLGALSSNPFHHYIGSLAEALHIEAETLPVQRGAAAHVPGGRAGRPVRSAGSSIAVTQRGQR